MRQTLLDLRAARSGAQRGDAADVDRAAQHSRHRVRHAIGGQGFARRRLVRPGGARIC